MPAPNEVRRNFREGSRGQYGRDMPQDKWLTTPELQAGAQMRAADALERIADAVERIQGATISPYELNVERQRVKRLKAQVKKWRALAKSGGVE